MKKFTIYLLILCFGVCARHVAQAQEKFGGTLNLGLGVGGYAGYYGYLGRSVPVFHMNYEFDVARYFTLAPFISVYTFSDKYYYGSNNTPYQNYGYRETVLPIGLKGTYYFDELLTADGDWDFYLAGSLGAALVRSRWDDGYTGDRNYYNRGNSVFLDLHIGAEYHLNSRAGIFLDISTGVSTLGLAIH